jgi:hypothetical protein
LKFDVEALYRFYEDIGGIGEIIELTKTTKGSSHPEICARIIYSSALSSHPDFTLENARAIVCEMSPSSITDIELEFYESIGSTKNGVQKELQKKLMADFLTNLANTK